MCFSKAMFFVIIQLCSYYICIASHHDGTPQLHIVFVSFEHVAFNYIFQVYFMLRIQAYIESGFHVPGRDGVSRSMAPEDHSS